MYKQNESRRAREEEIHQKKLEREKKDSLPQLTQNRITPALLAANQSKLSPILVQELSNCNKESPN